MPRKRMIDPSIWQDDGMAALSSRQQLLYIGLFSNADDDGRLKGSPVAIRLILPTLYAGESIDEVYGDLNSVLNNMRQLETYEVDDQTYLQFKNYRKWQKIDRPQESNLPAPPDWIGESSTNDRGGLAPRGKEEKGEEKNGTEESEDAARATYEALPSAVKSRLESFAGCLPKSHKLAVGTMVTIARKYMALDLDEEGIKIAEYAKSAKAQSGWLTDGTILGWLGKERDRNHGGSGGSNRNGAQESSSGSSEFSKLDRPGRGGARRGGNGGAGGTPTSGDTPVAAANR